mmetsp:Transcript_5743/g.18036  ORF Transcript_5743/g.18036 Transcript_5743/m.18036 type:complete len:214 (-) Transcript_5743:176-817(-)
MRSTNRGSAGMRASLHEVTTMSVPTTSSLPSPARVGRCSVDAKGLPSTEKAAARSSSGHDVASTPDFPLGTISCRWIGNSSTSCQRMSASCVPAAGPAKNARRKRSAKQLPSSEAAAHVAAVGEHGSTMSPGDGIAADRGSGRYTAHTAPSHARSPTTRSYANDRGRTPTSESVREPSTWPRHARDVATKPSRIWRKLVGAGAGSVAKSSARR